MEITCLASISGSEMPKLKSQAVLIDIPGNASCMSSPLSFFEACFWFSIGSLTINRPNGVTFKAAGGSTEFVNKWNPEIGDIVSFKHWGFLFGSKKPVNPTLHRLCPDLTWDSVVENWKEQTPRPISTLYATLHHTAPQHSITKGSSNGYFFPLRSRFENEKGQIPFGLLAKDTSPAKTIWGICKTTRIRSSQCCTLEDYQTSANRVREGGIPLHCSELDWN